MTVPRKTLEFRFERTIDAAPEEVFDAWLNPETSGTPWHEHDELLFHPEVDGLWYWRVKGKALYGRFTDLERPGRIRLTWMSRNTLGVESIVTVTFQKQGARTLMTLVHSGIPDSDLAPGHDAGWAYFLDQLVGHFAK